jgi:HPr kinase/phosphorylase
MLRRHMREDDALSRSEAENVHASAVAVGARALLIRGASGTGKSGLALRLLALGAELIADDRVILTRRGDRIHASAPEALRGLIEARGVGLLRTERLRAEAEVALVVDLNLAPSARMPQSRVIHLLGVELALISAKGVPNIDAVLVFFMQNARYIEN